MKNWRLQAFGNVITRMLSLFGVWFYRKDWQHLEQVLRQLISDRPFIPDIAQQILVIDEDRRFLDHSGVDTIAIARVIWRKML